MSDEFPVLDACVVCQRVWGHERGCAERRRDRWGYAVAALVVAVFCVLLLLAVKFLPVAVG